jgi:hypothetical protein
MASNEPFDPMGTLVQSSGRQAPPDLRLLHFNDVYHIECVPPAADWCGGILNLA